MSDPLGLISNTIRDPLGLLSRPRPIPELRSAPPEEESFIGSLWDRFATDKPAERAKAANAVALSEELNIPPSVAYEHMDQISQEIGLRDQPTFQEMIERPIMGAVVYGLLSHPLSTIVGVTTFGLLAEAENYLVSKSQQKPYQFGAGKGLADILPDDTSRGVEDLVWTADMAWKAVVAGGVIKYSRPAAEKFAMEYMRDIAEKYNLPRTVFISPEKIREFHGLERESIISPEEASMLKDLGLTRQQYVEALKNGIDLEIPAEKIVTIADKPWWATMKRFFRATPYEETIVTAGKAEARRPVAGLLEESRPDYAAEAAQAGVVFNGLQETGEGKRPLPLFTDPVTKSTFTLSEGETIPDALAKVRERFQKKAPSKGEIVQPGAKLGAKQLREMTHEDLKAKYPSLPQEIVDRLGKITVDPRHAGEGKFVPGEGLNIKGNDQSLLHEVGHIIDNILTPAQAAQWEGISKEELKNGILGNKPDKLAADPYSVWENLYSAFSIYHRNRAGEKLLPSEVASLEKYPKVYQFVKDNLSEGTPTVTKKPGTGEIPAKEPPTPEAGVYRARGLEDAITLRQQEPEGSLANYDERSQKEWLRGQAPPKDGKITLYRATSTGEEIKPGDYVTNSRQYAKDHIEANLGKGKIAKIEATLDDIYPADGPGEFWYAPKSIETTPEAVGGNPFENSVVKEPVFHGTDRVFDEFNASELGRFTGAKSAKEGFFFTSSKQNAELYAGMPLTKESIAKWEQEIGAVKLEYNEAQNIFRSQLRERVEFRKKYGIQPDHFLPASELEARGYEPEEIAEIEKKISTLPQEAHQQANEFIRRGKEAGRVVSQSEQEIKRLNMLLNSTRSRIPGAEDFEGIDSSEEAYLTRERQPKIKEVYLDLRNPLVVDGKEVKSISATINQAKKNGNDGVILKGLKDPLESDVYVIFSEKQIKLLPTPSRPPEVGGQVRQRISPESGLQKEPLETPEDINAVFEAAARTDAAVAPPITSEYDKIRAEAARIAYKKISKKIDLQKRRETRAIKRQGIEDARQDPVYTTMQEIVNQGGLNRDKLLTTWDKDIVKELSRKRVGLVTKEGKLGFDEIAEYHGFVSDDALMSMMLDWKGLAKQGKIAAERFEEQYYDLLNEAEKEEFHLSLLEEEAKILRGMLKKAKPSAPGIKKVIREQTGQIRVDELMISEYEALKAGMKKAELAARKAFREGKLDGALAEKERQIEMAMARKEKLQAKQEAKDIHDGIIKLTKDKAIPEDYRDRIQDLLEDFDLLPRSGKMAKRVESAREFLERQKQAGEDVTIPESMLNRIERYGKTHWRELNLDQLREIYEQAQMYAHLGKLKNKLIAQKEKRDFEAVVAKIVLEINKNWNIKPVGAAELEKIFLEKTFFEELSEQKESYLGSLVKIETYLRRLDGFKDLGPVWETLYLPAKQASDVEYRRLTEIIEKLRALFDPIKKTLTKEKFRIEGVSQFLTRETVIMVALNSGNEGNIAALRENKVYGWNDQQIQKILGNVRPEEWELVRGVWDLFETQFPDLADVYKNLSGTSLKKVEGDYFPLVFDRQLSLIADRNATEAELRDFFKSIYTLPSVKTGSTIERVGGKLPPKLKFTVIFEKLAEINHYITHAEAVRDTQKILADPRVRAAIESAPHGIGGPEAYREMMNWLQDVARQQKDPMTAVEAAVKTARINTSVVAMGWKFSTAAVQFLGAGNTIYKVGAGEFTKALAEFYTNREVMVERIKGMSAEMSGRSKSFDRELRDAYNRLGLEHFRGSQALKDSYFSLISLMDMAIAYPTWLSGYNKGLKDFAGDEAKAIEYADMLTRMTQGNALVKDLAGIQRGSEMKKLLSMFYTFFSSYHQLMSDAWLKFKFDKTGQNFGDLLKAWWWLTIVPPLLEYFMKEREIPSVGDFLKAVLQFRLTAYPVVRDITGAALTDYDYQFSPVARAGEVTGRLVKEVSEAVTPDEEMEWDKILRYGFEFSGYFFGLPTGQAVVTMQGLMDLLNGETSDVTRLLMRAPREENE